MKKAQVSGETIKWIIYIAILIAVIAGLFLIFKRYK